MTLAPDAPCPCGKLPRYADCCGRFHSGAIPATAEELMRSRYSAYVLGLTDYLMSTWHPETLGEITPASLAESLTGKRWDRLKVVQRKAGGPDDQTGTIHFRAYYTEDQHPQTLEEVSRFERVDGRWVYKDGDVLRR